MAAVAVPGSLTAVKACHASGKTFTAAELVLWWVFAQGGIAITTAPGWNQVEKLMWTEVHKAYHGSRFPLGGRLLDTELKVRPGVYALGLSTDEGVRFQGFHGKVLVVDRGSGVAVPRTRRQRRRAPHASAVLDRLTRISGQNVFAC